jgi:capsular polysaccharide biosynthesis protein
MCVEHRLGIQVLYNSQLDGKEYTAPMGAELRSGMHSREAAEGEYFLSLRDLLQTIWRRIWLILLVAIVFTGAAVGFSLAQTPMYEASIAILVGQERTSTPGDLGGNVQGLQQLTQTMAEGINSRPVAEAVIQQHDLWMTQEDFLEDYLNVEQIGATQFIEVAYRDSSPERAQQVADTVGEVFSEQVTEVSPSANDVTATVWEQAELPNEPVSPNFVLNVGLALVAGLMLGAMLAFLLEYLDDSWHSPEEAEQVSGVPTFGVIPEFDVSKGKKGSR